MADCRQGTPVASVKLAFGNVTGRWTEIRSRGGRSRLVASRKLPIGIGVTKSMTWVVCPGGTVEAGVPDATKSIAVKEGVIDEYCTVEPVRAPAPTTPAAPSAEAEANVNGRSPSESECRIVERRVVTPHRRPPDICRVINRYVDYIGIGWLK